MQFEPLVQVVAQCGFFQVKPQRRSAKFDWLSLHIWWRLYTKHIVGLKKEESDAVLRMLYDQTSKSADIQVRTKWERRTVVAWDNRSTTHTVVFDFDPKKRRHVVRITPRGEKPIPVST